MYLVSYKYCTEVPMDVAGLQTSRKFRLLKHGLEAQTPATRLLPNRIYIPICFGEMTL